MERFSIFQLVVLVFTAWNDTVLVLGLHSPGGGDKFASETKKAMKCDFLSLLMQV